MTHRIADTFYDSLNKLSQQEQKIVKQSAFDFQLDPSQASFSMHKVDRGRDPNLWTARVNRDIRMVVHKKGGDTLLAWVGHHIITIFVTGISVDIPAQFQGFTTALCD